LRRADRKDNALAQLAELGDFAFGFEDDADLAAAFGAGVSVLRTLPQGSAGAFASGIFFKDSW
jgi:hypothetical protein